MNDFVLKVKRTTFFGFAATLGLASSGNTGLMTLSLSTGKVVRVCTPSGTTSYLRDLGTRRTRSFPSSFFRSWAAWRAVYDQGLTPNSPYLDRNFRRTKSLRHSSQADHSIYHSLHPGLVEINTANPHPTDLRCCVQSLPGVSIDAGYIDAMDCLQETIQDAFESHDDIWEFGQGSSTRQSTSIVDNDLDAQDAFAFGTYLCGELVKVNFEHRQIICRSLDHNLQSRTLFAFVPVRAFLGAEDGLGHLDIQAHACALYDSMKDLIQNAAPCEQ